MKNKVIVSINQPAYMPWLGYLERIVLSDIHIVLDDVQFEKNSMTNRNIILSNSRKLMLTIPLRTKGRFGDLLIHDVEIDNNQKWIKKHIASIRQSYSKSPYFTEFFPILEQYYTDIKISDSLGEVLRKNLDILVEYLALDTNIIYSSELEYKGAKNELILDICKKVGATSYLSGPFGRDYLDIKSFEKDDICVIFHDYIHPEYMQMPTSFIPRLSVLDMIFNEGTKASSMLATSSELYHSHRSI